MSHEPIDNILMRVRALQEEQQSGESTTHQRMTQYVYFIKNENTGLIKVGCSANVKKRKDALKNTEKAPMTYIGYMSGGREKEKELHEQFREYHDHGEWFKSHPVFLNFVQDTVIKSYPPEEKSAPLEIIQLTIRRGETPYDALCSLLDIKNPPSFFTIRYVERPSNG